MYSFYRYYGIISTKATRHCLQCIQYSELIPVTERSGRYLIVKAALLYVKFAKRIRVMYGCETWSLTLMEEHRLKVLRAGGWGDGLDLTDKKQYEAARKLFNEDLHNLHSWPNILRMIQSTRSPGKN
jgi:hypothetical protein